MNQNNFILADGRWSGPFGIGRISSELLSRLKHTDIFTQGPKPLSPKNFIWLPYQLLKKKQYKIFFMPGFNPTIYSPIPFVFTICDLIHLHFSSKNKNAKKFYYEQIIKPGIHRAHKILTISEFSKKTIIEWTNISADKVIVIPCGISKTLTPEGKRFSPGYPYLLYVGNTKSHKNISRLLHAFATAKIDTHIRLILTGKITADLAEIINTYKLNQRIIFCDELSEIQLAEYYRGALALLMPSLYEGFGLPVLEAMSCGTPVLTSNVTSLPEVAGEAALLINPFEIDDIACGIERIVNDNELRRTLKTKGFEQIKLFSWDHAAKILQKTLEDGTT